MNLISFHSKPLFFTMFYNSVPESELRPGSLGFSVSCDPSTKDREEQHQVFSHFMNTVKPALSSHSKIDKT